MSFAITEEQIPLYALVTLRISMKAYLQSNGRMQLTRTATPANMRDMASRFTGIRYGRSRKGLELAYSDICELCESLKKEA